MFIRLAATVFLLITLLQARESASLPLPTMSAVTGIAVTSSLVAKAILATVSGNLAMGRRVATGYALALLAGALMAFGVSLVQA